MKNEQDTEEISAAAWFLESRTIQFLNIFSLMQHASQQHTYRTTSCLDFFVRQLLVGLSLEV